MQEYGKYIISCRKMYISYTFLHEIMSFLSCTKKDSYISDWLFTKQNWVELL